MIILLMPLLNDRNVEIDEKTQPFTGQPEIRKELGLVDWLCFLDSFQLADHQLFHQYVESKSRLEHKAVINYRHNHLLSELEA